MRVVFFLFLLLLPLPLAIYAEDLGELSANPVGLSGSSGSFSFLVCLVHLVFRSDNPMKETN